jgi:hypothetical protein
MIGLLAPGIICFDSIEFLLYPLANSGREAKNKGFVHLRCSFKPRLLIW